MKIVIIGAGNAGKSLTAKLCEMGHDVVVIDKDPVALDELSQEHDVMTLEGNGGDPSILEEINISKVDLLAAVTSHDEANVLACCWAKNAGVGHTIARLSDDRYLKSSLVDMNKLGIDRALEHKAECAEEIFDVLYMPGTLEVTSMLDDKIAAIGLKLPSNSPLAGKSLKDFKTHEWFGKVRFIGLVQDGELIIPDGNSQAFSGDHIYFVLPSSETEEFLDWIMAGRRKGFKKTVIVGGGELGIALAELLEETSMETILIEKDRGTAEIASETLQRCLVLNADAAKATTLKEAGIDSDTAFVAITGDEEMNIVCCIQARQLGAGFTMSRIDQSEYVPIIDNLKLVDRIVSPNISLVKAILRYVRGELVEEVGLFHRIAGEIQEVIIKADSKRDGSPISKLKLSRSSIVAAVQREGQVLVPTGDFVLRANDRLAIYCLPDTAEKIKSAF